MNKVSKISAVGCMLVLAVSLSGCQNAASPAPQKAPEVVLQEGLTKLANVTSYGYDVSLKGDLKGPVDPATGTVDKPEKVMFNMSMTGGIDMKNANDPRLNLNVKGDMSADADGGSGEFSFRMNKESIFASLMKLEGKGSVQIPEEMKKEVLGKWWVMPLPPEALEELSKTLPTGGDENMTESQKKMKKLVEETKFFKDVKYVGMENVGGEESYHYTSSLDKAAFTDFVAKASELENQSMDSSAKEEMKKAMEIFDFSGDMYVGKTSGVLNKVKGVMTLKAGGSTPSPTGSVNVEATLKDLNKAVTVEVPADAQPVPMEALGALPL